jgi:uncharacterized protein (UPF0276 family)
MLSVAAKAGETAVGLAYSPAMAALARRRPGLTDYLEVPFELLRHMPAVAEVQEEVPLLLHCASLSVGGFVAPAPQLIDDIAAEAERMAVPWISEHLAFISADPLPGAESDEPAQLTYTVCPQLSEEVVDQVARNVAALAPKLPAPLIVENSPLYFEMPGSSMNMVQFVSRVVEATGIGLLLDLSHYLIAASNTGFDAEREFERLPLENVVEVHLSGQSLQSGIHWDDHACPASERQFALLERLLERSRPQAITFEYNWNSAFPQALVEAHLERARAMAGR